jgi:hypothetical protein
LSRHRDHNGEKCRNQQFHEFTPRGNLRPQADVAKTKNKRADLEDPSTVFAAFVPSSKRKVVTIGVSAAG